MLVGLLAIILTLLLVVGIHEAGHALAARLFKVKINKISLGFGRPLLHWRSKKDCEWIVALWPLGGYVELLNSRIKPVAPKEYPFCFDKQPIWKRVIILLAGVVANLITAWCAFVLVFFVGINANLPQINSVTANSVAAQAGIRVGDKVQTINQHPTANWQEVNKQLIIFWGSKNVVMKLRKINGGFKEVILDLSQLKWTGKEKSLLNSLGIAPNLLAPKVVVRAASFGEAVKQASNELVQLSYFFIMILKQLFMGVIPFSILLGPIGLFAASVASLMQGLVVFAFFIATFSLAVALVNLFPLPGLDGGAILYCLIEKIRGQPISVALEVLLYQLMWIVFILLLVQLVLNDVVRWLGN